MSYTSWFGKSTVPALHYNRSVLSGVVPPSFLPTDISGLQGWLDANDPTTITVNEFNTVLLWQNKGDLSGNFDISGNADVEYGVNTVNGLNVVTFNPFSFMSGTFPLDFQDRSIFIVTRRSVDVDVSAGFLAFWTSDVSGGMETAVAKSGGDYTYLLAKHPGAGVEVAFTTTINTTGGAELLTFINSSTDLSGNYAGLNGIQQTLVFGALANYNTSSIPYFLGNYANGETQDNTYDMCEVCLYNRVLTVNERIEVEAYLQRKWRVKVPPVPITFAPVAVFDFNNYVEFDSTLVDTLSGDPAAINEPFGNTFDTSDASNNYLTIGAPNNFPSQTGGILLPTITDIQAIEVWVRYEEWAGYSQYVLDARTGAADTFWITSGDAIGAGWDAGTFYNNTVSTAIDSTAGTPIVANEIAGAGWRQLWFLPPSPITDDVALFMRFTGEQGMPVDIAYIAVYDTIPTEANVIARFNADCARYGLSPI